MSSSMASKSSDIAVLFVPFAAHSHFNQLFQLSQIISSYNDTNNAISVHFIGSTFQNARVKSRAMHALNPNCAVRFHDIPNPAPTPLQAQSPDTDTHELHTNPCIPWHLHAYSVAYVEYLRPHVAGLLTSLTAHSRRVVVVHDTLMSSAVQDVVSLPNAETYVFHSVSTVSSLSFLLSVMGEKMVGGIPSAEGCLSPEIGDFLVSQYEFVMSNGTSGKLQNTCRVVESDFVDLLLEREREVVDQSLRPWAIGPLQLQRLKKVKVNAKPSSSLKHGKVKLCLEWLDKQDKNSVLYVCFGTSTILEEEQLGELAIGLERSGTKFIWVLIDAEDFGEVFLGARVSRTSKLPLGFEERVSESGTGMVVREWAPQLEILGHPSTGGFLSHCGWNSCLESLSLCVPLLTWPMHSDQPMNAALMTDIVKAGMAAREWAKRNEMVSSSEIAEVVKRLMNSEEGDEVRKRAEELGVELRKSTEEGGVSRLELDSFVAHITR